MTVRPLRSKMSVILLRYVENENSPEPKIWEASAPRPSSSLSWYRWTTRRSSWSHSTAATEQRATVTSGSLDTTPTRDAKHSSTYTRRRRYQSIERKTLEGKQKWVNLWRQHAVYIYEDGTVGNVGGGPVAARLYWWGSPRGVAHFLSTMRRDEPVLPSRQQRATQSTTVLSSTPSPKYG